MTAKGMSTGTFGKFRTVAALAAGLLALVCVLAHAAAPVKKVSGIFTYYGTRDDSPAVCKARALEGARLDALSKEFGTIVSQDVMQADRIDSRGETTNFFSLSTTDVKGEWLADDGQPQYDVTAGSDDCLVVTCRVSGTARAISNEAVEFKAVALRNGSDASCASTEYRDGDDLFLSFTSPADGWLAVYLMLEDSGVMQVLPYYGEMASAFKVKKNFDYIFFDSRRSNYPGEEVMEFGVETAGNIEFNKIYVIFSTAPFNPCADARVTDGVPMLTTGTFMKWLARQRRNDPRMNVKQINLKLIPAI